MCRSMCIFELQQDIKNVQEYVHISTAAGLKKMCRSMCIFKLQKDIKNVQEYVHI